MENSIKVRLVNGEIREYHKGITLFEISQDVRKFYTTPIVTAKVNNEIKDLQSCVNIDCDIDFFDLSTDQGNKVYQRSLSFVLIAAARELYPQGEVTIEHSLSKGLYCELYIGRDLTEDDIKALECKMREIVDENKPIAMKSLPIAEAIKLFENVEQYEKVEHLKQLNRERVRVYYCGEVYDYFYGTMAPFTGCLQVFALKPHAKGVVLCFPQKETPDRLTEFVQQNKLSEIFLEAENWGKILRCGYVAALNNYVDNEGISDIIRVAEALHEKKIAQIADFVSQHKEVRIILVAGPSSSGKTTFAQRLGVQLRVNGLSPVPISLDDYFVDRDKTPRDEWGDYDFEAIEAIDLALFNQDLLKLLDGKEVALPTYNFKTGQREYSGNKIKITKDQPLIIEGIHGLNERLTSAVPRQQKVKIYISALTQLAIDNHNRIPTTDTRLIRRIVRDSQFRSHDALKTLKMWPSVRRGEERNIFPFQEDADIMFNSALIYELGVLKKYAEDLLSKVTPEHAEYSEARRLLIFLSYFKDIAEDQIPLNSILREFIGKSCFHS